MGLLQKIRSKSDREKNIISLVSAGIITLIIVILWLGFGKFVEPKSSNSDLKLSSLSPFQTFKEQFFEIKKDLDRNFIEVKEKIGEVQDITKTPKNNN